ncbi:MAG: hypothetical protein ABI772_08150 [Bacteroidota bacterium]
MKHLKSIFFAFALLLLASCNFNVEMDKMSAMENFSPGKTDKDISLSYTEAIDSGFIIPSAQQTGNGYFNFRFRISNKNFSKTEYIYKIFYQNESYFFKEAENEKYNPASSENFYGSWELPGINTKSVVIGGRADLIVLDSLRITGNPRNEPKYYGSPSLLLSQEEVTKTVGRIKSDPVWLKAIVQKAITEKKTVDEQLELDARYVLDEERKKQSVNLRWRRNPRTGTYRFYLMVYSKSYEKQIPEYVKNISVRPGDDFINPLAWLKEKKYDASKCLFLPFDETLSVAAHVPLETGIYINKKSYPTATNRKLFSKNCSDSLYLYKNAAFEQYFHSLPPNFVSPNIPVVKDLQDKSFTADDYTGYVNKFNEKKLLPLTNKATQCPCETVVSDSAEKKIVMWNPGFRNNDMIKENVGVNSRHGFTYGTYTFKVKMPRLLNVNNQWNGLTNALWLINQRNEDWNNRRFCPGDAGYIPKDKEGPEAERRLTTYYTEIDFEIRKASPVWPKSSYDTIFPRPAKTESDPGDIVVLCTNWDLACQAPKNFTVGAKPLKHNNNNYVLHRWTHWYQALSSKFMAKDEEIFGGDYYYFQIEWKPETITWRVGPEKDKLYEVGYMDSFVTSIPNNQMLIVFTQEYHLSTWWPESPFLQEYIPIPAKDIKGEILEVTIE